MKKSVRKHGNREDGNLHLWCPFARKGFKLLNLHKYFEF